MPRIPMSDRGFVPHVDNSVRMTGAPGMGFGMENARALRGAANDLNDFSRDMLALGGAMKEFVEREAETQNRLAATNARNLYRAYNEELENRMAENPTQFQEFSKWADETDQKYLDDVRQYTDQMTTPFREQFNAEMEGVRINSLSQRRKIGIQAKVTADYNMAQTLLKDAAERGDMDGYMRILNENKGVLFSEQEYDMRKLEYDRLADSAAAKRMVDACISNADGTDVPPEQSFGKSAAAVKQLREKNSEGSYVNFTHLSEDYRDRLIRAAETQKNKAELDYKQAFLAQANQGIMPTEDQLKEKHKTGELTDEEFNWKLDIVKQYNAQIERERKQREAEVERVQKERASIILSAQKEQEAIRKAQEEEEKAAKKAQEAAEKAAHDELVADWMLNIELTNFSSIPEVNAQQKKKLYDGAQVGIKDSPSLLKILKALNERSQAGLNGTDEFSSPNGKLVKDYILKKFMNKSRTEFTGLIYDDGFWSNGEDSQAFQSSRFLEVYELAKSRLTEGKDYFTIKTEIDECVAALNAGKVEAILMRSADDWKLPTAPRTSISMLPKEEKKPDRSYKGDAIVRASVPMWPR